MSNPYDLIVIGSGTAVIVAASRMAAADRKVAVIDFRPFGGTCALRGCDSKKMLITGAQVMDDIWRMRDRGIVTDNAHIDWCELMAFKRSFTGPVPEKEKNYHSKGVDTFHTRARFTGPTTVEVEGTGPFKARHVLIATGGQP